VTPRSSAAQLCSFIVILSHVHGYSRFSVRSLKTIGLATAFAFNFSAFTLRHLLLHFGTTRSLISCYLSGYSFPTRTPY
jgi:hypothetical protein